jgi:hypothetical protein
MTAAVELGRSFNIPCDCVERSGRHRFTLLRQPGLQQPVATCAYPPDDGV